MNRRGSEGESFSPKERCSFSPQGGVKRGAVFFPQ